MLHIKFLEEGLEIFKGLRQAILQILAIHNYL